MAAAALMMLAAGCATAGDGGSSGSDAATGADAAGSTADSGISADAAPVCDTSPCHILDQCGCSTGEACDFGASPVETECRAADATGTEQTLCTNSEQCAPGYGCFNTGGPGHCRQFCDADDPGSPCGASANCLLNINDGSGGTLPDLQLCTKACAPEKATNNGCPTSTLIGCNVLVFNAGMANEIATTDCRPANPAGTDEVDCSAATGVNNCAAGFTCVTFTIGMVVDREVCKQTCLVNGGACNTGSCGGFGTPLIVEGTEYGICN